MERQKKPNSSKLPGYVACKGCDRFRKQEWDVITCEDNNGKLIRVRIVYNRLVPGGATFSRGADYSPCPTGRLKN
jgi:hypothetical protein